MRQPAKSDSETYEQTTSRQQDTEIGTRERQASAVVDGNCPVAAAGLDLPGNTSGTVVAPIARSVLSQGSARHHQRNRANDCE